MNLNSKQKFLELSKRYSALIIIIFLVVLFAALNPRFLSAVNITNIVRQAAIMIIVACGATFIMIAGDVDISCGGVACIAAIIAAICMKKGMGVPVAITVAVSGILVSRFAFPPMIATLCVTNLTTGIGNLITNGTAIYDLPDEFLVLGRGYIGPIPVQVVIMAVITVISGIVLSSTTYGRYIYAIGGNTTVAKLSGVNVSKLKVTYYMVGGALSALAGVLITSRMGTAQPTLGTNWPMETIAGIVIGGTHFQGGSGTIVNSVLGVLLMTMITNGLNLLGVNTFWQSVVSALLLIITIVISTFQDRKKGLL